MRIFHLIQIKRTHARQNPCPCFQDRTERLGSEAQNEDPQAGFTLHNVIVLCCAQFSHFIGMKTCPYVMRSDVAALRIITFNPRNNSCKQLHNPSGVLPQR